MGRGVGGGRCVEVAGIWGPCAYLGVFQFLYQKVLVSRIAEGWGCV
jgi:hypothetical protein